MKLLFYIPGLVDGGAERVMASLASHFAGQGFDVVLAVDFKVNADGPPLDPAVSVIELTKGHGGSIRHLSRLLASERPDIVLSAIASCNFKLVVASLLARLTGKPGSNLVLTYHGFEEYKSGWMSWLGYISLPVISRIAAKIVAVSDSLRDDLATNWKAKRTKLLRIYNPVNLPVAPENFTLPKNTQELKARDDIILSVGRLVAGKRFDLLIRAFAEVSDQSARLVILGDGPERAKLGALIDELDLSERVELVGFTQNTGQYYAQAKCFVLSSEKESFGLVLVEALAYGLPIISADCGGPREVLEHGRMGTLLGKNPTPTELAYAIDKVLVKPGDPLPCIEHAKNFDMETGAKQYARLFEQILDNKS